MYYFDKKMTKEEIEFFGKNKGEPWTNPDTFGMIGNKNNVL